MIKEHDRIVLKTAVPTEGLEAGDVGTVVHVYHDGQAYEVEFVALDGHTTAVVTLEATQNGPLAEPHLAALDRHIDRLVYDLYGVTPEEIAIVEAEKH
jgi:hypothetical protein